MADFDPVSFSAGIGAGQEATNRANNAAQNAEHAAAMARIQADSARSSANTSQDVAMIAMMGVQAKQAEINQKWIPYANKLQVSIIARRAEKEDLIAALKAADPTNADRIIEKANQHAVSEFERIKADPEALKKIQEETLRKAEEGRLDR